MAGSPTRAGPSRAGVGAEFPAALRLPLAVTNALAVAADYLLLRQLLRPAVALLAGLFWAASLSDRPQAPAPPRRTAHQLDQPQPAVPAGGNAARPHRSVEAVRRGTTGRCWPLHTARRRPRAPKLRARRLRRRT
jgi:hypothetical protein